MSTEYRYFNFDTGEEITSKTLPPRDKNDGGLLVAKHIARHGYGSFAFFCDNPNGDIIVAAKGNSSRFTFSKELDATMVSSLYCWAKEKKLLAEKEKQRELAIKFINTASL